MQIAFVLIRTRKKVSEIETSVRDARGVKEVHALFGNFQVITKISGEDELDLQENIRGLMNVKNIDGTMVLPVIGRGKNG